MENQDPRMETFNTIQELYGQFRKQKNIQCYLDTRPYWHVDKIWGPKPLKRDYFGWGVKYEEDMGWLDTSKVDPWELVYQLTRIPGVKAVSAFAADTSRGVSYMIELPKKK